MKNKQETVKKKRFLFMLVLFSCVYYFLIVKGKINLSILTNTTDLSNHFNFITVNSVFVGFLFSSLSLILGLSGTSSIIRLEKAGFMENIYRNISMGIFLSFISIICSLSMIFLKNYIIKIPLMFYIVVPSIELLSLLLTLIVFFKATRDVWFIIKIIRNKIKKSIPSDDDLNETIRLIK